ncbi:MAG: zinc-binding dehydrogenase, partial [Xanthomonadales bacterium]|nr:zinc-binding dehydrogenase [Xanthomonadales bacterium]
AANIALLKEASLIGVWWGTWTRHDPQGAVSNMQELAQMAESGVLNPRVTASYPLDRYVDAFAAITERRALGKVVLTM